jgi:hypothetical protein
MCLPLVWMSGCVVWMAFTAMSGVSAGLLCKDSTIDSITYVKDSDMYFFTSGGYYWYIKQSQFPPPDSAAKKIPAPFTMGQSAVYVDSTAGCGSAKTAAAEGGLKKGEKTIWVSEVVGGRHMFMAFDVTTGKWRPAVEYNSDRCFSTAMVEWGSQTPIDAMFAVNYLSIFIVKDNKYARLDCSSVCKGNDYGKSSPPFAATDLQTSDPIQGMYTKSDTELFLFNKKTFRRLIIKVDQNGRISAVKDTQENHILKDFFKISSPGECVSEGGGLLGFGGGGGGGGHPSVQEANESQDHESESQTSGGGEGKAWIWIVVVIIAIIAVVAIGLFVFFAVKPKPTASAEAGARPPPTASPKAGPPKAGVGAAKPPGAASKIAGAKPAVPAKSPALKK